MMLYDTDSLPQIPACGQFIIAAKRPSHEAVYDSDYYITTLLRRPTHHVRLTSSLQGIAGQRPYSPSLSLITPAAQAGKQFYKYRFAMFFKVHLEKHLHLPGTFYCLKVVRLPLEIVQYDQYLATKIFHVLIGMVYTFPISQTVLDLVLIQIIMSHLNYVLYGIKYRCALRFIFLTQNVKHPHRVTSCLPR